LQTSQTESGDPNIVWDAAGPSKAAAPANEEVTMAKKAKKGEEGEKGEKGQSEEIGR
jgi:hypothetical protein